jgi:hypothetical protein
MPYLKLDNNTWVQVKPTQTIEDLIAKMRKDPPSSFAFKADVPKEKCRRRSDAVMDKLYRKFVNEVFRERDFISQRDFNVLITKHFNASPTSYRQKMVKMELITEHNKLVKKKITESITE